MDLLDKAGDVLKQISDEAALQYKKDMNLKYSSVVNAGLWISSVEIEWPEKARFSGVSAKKKLAQKIADKHLLKSLLEKNLVSPSGKLTLPITFSEATNSSTPGNEASMIFNNDRDSGITDLEFYRDYCYNSDSSNEVISSDNSSPTNHKNCVLNRYSQVKNRNNIVSDAWGRKQFENVLLEVIEGLQKLSIRSYHTTSPTRDKTSDKVKVKELASEEVSSDSSSRKVKKKTKKKKVKNGEESIVNVKADEKKSVAKEECRTNKDMMINEEAKRGMESVVNVKANEKVIVAKEESIESQDVAMNEKAPAEASAKLTLNKNSGPRALYVIPARRTEKTKLEGENTNSCGSEIKKDCRTDKVENKQEGVAVDSQQSVLAQSLLTRDVEEKDTSLSAKRRKRKKESSVPKAVKTETIASEVPPCSEQSSDITSSDLKTVEGRYPHPKGTLHNIYAVVAQNLKDTSHHIQKSYHMVPVRTGKTSQTMWNCTYKVRWPTEATFSATMPSKSLAGKQASLKALNWLQTQGKLTKAGAPVLYDPTEVKEMAKIPAQIIVDPSLNDDIKLLLSSYKKNIEPLLNELEPEINADKESKKIYIEDELSDDYVNRLYEGIFGNDLLTNPITGSTNQEKDPASIAERNKKLYSRFRRRKDLRLGDEESETLPITKFKNDILKKMNENRVLIIKGEPGCGKSTQVPQYLMEYFESMQKGTECNVIITQPRRISAISLAEWVAHQREERLGDVVGFQVRLKYKLPRPPGGALLFCSTGILLRRLQTNPGLIGASHVILDEAHERDISTDMLLVLLRRALKLNPDLRVIVMSATINAELFQDYFKGSEVIHVPGFTFPVKSTFLEDLHIQANASLMRTPNIDSRLVTETIMWVDKNRPEGAILCFLPGWAEIVSVKKRLEKLEDVSHLVLPVHSRLSYAEQHRIFHRPPPGVRKIILATNIAETSITIDDVKYVIDTGAHKEERLSAEQGLSCLDNQWVSQANVNQRKGRAGRVQPGECFHLYTQEMYELMDKFPVPEILRVPLEKTVLDLKTYSQDEKAEEFLSEMPEPPTPLAVCQAVKELVQLGALDEKQNLSALGRRIAMFSTHPKLSKALVHSAIFRCVSPILTVSTILSGEAELFVGGLANKENVRLIKRKFHPSSDHIALAWLYQQWESLMQESEIDATLYCDSRSLNSDSLNIILKLRRLYSEHLWQSRMLDDLDDYKDMDAVSNMYSGNDEIVKAVFFSGTGSLLYRRSWDIKDGRLLKDANVVFTETGRRTTIGSESVNFKRTDFPSPYLTYFRQVESSERRTVMIRETSLLSPLSVLLFSEGQITAHEYIPPPTEGKKWDEHMLLKINRHKRDVVFLCHTSIIEEITELRSVIWNLINYFVLKSGVEEDDERYKTILGYHERLLKILSSMLYKSGAMIEYDKYGNQRV